MLLLPFAQLGAALHALSHSSHVQTRAMAAQGEDAHGRSETSGGAHVCAGCLAYAHLGAVDLPDLLTPPLLTGLVFGLGVAPLAVELFASVPVLRNRGPPALR